MSYDQLLFLALQNCLAKLMHIATDTKVPLGLVEVYEFAEVLLIA